MAPHFHNFETTRSRILTGTAKIRQQNRRKRQRCAVINKKISVHFCTDILRGKQEFSCTVILLHCRYPCWQNHFLSVPLLLRLEKTVSAHLYLDDGAPRKFFVCDCFGFFSVRSDRIAALFLFFDLFHAFPAHKLRRKTLGRRRFLLVDERKNDAADFLCDHLHRLTHG